ncbi:MAG: hypothetical protein H0V82_06920 [Candidatus Protochlamydia sp.]|nr:hypothetical protein [Candidatus Protochlamydia sp.]
MSFRPIDFQGLMDLDQKIVDQLEKYLQQKETRLSHQILTIIQPMPMEAYAPLLSFNGGHLKLSDAVEGFTKKVRLIVKGGLNNLPKYEGDKAVAKINRALWEFTEVLEGCVVELFQQIKQVSVDRWHVSIAHVVLAIKNMLIHYIEDLIWAIRRLEKPLKEYNMKFEKKERMWSKLWSYWEKSINPELIKNLKQSETFLKEQYEIFNQSYIQFLHINVKVEDLLIKMKTFPVLALLEVPEQNLYIDVFRLLKILELNTRPKGSLALDTIRSLKNLTSVDNVIWTLRIYYRGLKDAFFNSSYELKCLKNEPHEFDASLEKLKFKVKEYQHELKELIVTMVHYRVFILKTDANPYVRSRWGFTEWIVGPEPVKSKKLLNLIYSAEELSKGYSGFLISLEGNFKEMHQQRLHIHQEIEKLLHEMGQPLISRSMMRNRVNGLLEELKKYDEIGSPELESIDYVDTILAKAMREDWKYHILHEFSLFHELYRLHLGLCDYIEDPSHAFRMERFRLLFDQIEDWLNKGDIYSHVHEIELDINDMKAYLQDFLAAIQRIVKEKPPESISYQAVHKYKQELLEYRYVFGQFFFILLGKESDGQLRNQFLFVDQYFETVENLLADLLK